MGFKTVLKVENSSLQDIKEGMQNAGFRLHSMNESFKPQEIRDILTSVSSDLKDKVTSGLASLVPRGRAEFTNGADNIVVDDFDVVEQYRVYDDPVIIITEQVKGRTSSIVIEIIEDIIKVDLLKNAIISMNNHKFKTSIEDLARLQGKPTSVVYEKCVKSLIESSVKSIKYLDVKASRIVPKKSNNISTAKSKIPTRVRV